MIKHFKYSLEPQIQGDVFEKIDELLKSFFTETFSMQFDCKYCFENCMPEIFSIDGKFFINCENDTLESPFEVDSKALKQYKFSLKKFAKELAERNSIDFKPRVIDDKTFYIGHKIINNIEYEILYMIDLSDSHCKLKDITVQRIKAIKNSNRILIITPDSLLIDNVTETILKSISCDIISFNKCLKDNFILKTLFTYNKDNIEDLVKSFELVIISSKEIYLYGQKLKIANQSYKILNYLANNPNIFIPRSNSIAGIWGEDYFNGDKILADEISRIRKEIKKITDENIILVRNKTLKLDISSNKIFIN